MFRLFARRRVLTRTQTGLRGWWRREVTAPLDGMYENLDEHQQDDRPARSD